MPFELTIVTPEGRAFHGTVESAVLPGSEGDFGVLPGHEPFLTALRIGEADIDTGEKVLMASVTEGFAEIHGDEVTVMVSACEFAHEIDRERAELARERAKAMLDEMRTTEAGEDEYQAYQDAYSRAISRIAITDKFKA